LFEFGVDAFNDVTTAADKIRNFIAGVRQFSVESFVAMSKDTLAKWDAEFTRALLGRDFDTAGFMLGKLAGDLWQLFAGIRALAKLPGMTMKLARRFGSLLVSGARYSRSALVLLGDLLRQLAGAIKDAVELGYGALAGFFEDIPLLVRQLSDGALLFI